MTFGEELKDKLPSINSYTSGGLAFIHDLRDYLKEKSMIEKEYAAKLDQLNKRYYKQKERQGALLIGEQNGSAGDKKGSDETMPTDSLQKYGTLFKAWEDLLRESDEISQIRATYSEKIISEITDVLKQLSTKQEEARKKHMTFSLKLLDERNKAYADKDKSKQKYFDCCDLVEATKQRHEKATDEKQKEKLKAQMAKDTQEMHIAKNNYILALNVANSFKKKYYNSDMVTLMDQLEEQAIIRVNHLKDIINNYLRLEANVLTDSQSHLDKILISVSKISVEEDNALFVKTHKGAEPWQEPFDFKFESSLIFKDTDELVNDEQGKIYMYNKLGKIRGKLSLVENEILGKKRELEGLKNLFDAYTKNSSTGDADDVREQMIEAIRATTVLEGTKTRYTTSIDVIVGSIGEDDQGKRHNLVKSTFAIPTPCNYCEEKIWLQAGLTCKDCGYNCHAKCEMKVPAFCTNEKPTKGKKSNLAPSPSSSTLSAGPVRSSNSIASPASSNGGSAALNSPSLLGVSYATSPSSGVGANKGNTIKKGSMSVSANSGGAKSAKVLYGYEAANTDELTIEEGQIVRIIVNDDGTGWLKAELNGQEGLIPSAYVELLTGSAAVPAVATTQAKKSSAEKARALFDYDAQNADELTIATGDLMEIKKKGEDGWWEVSMNGKVGLIPSTYVEIV